MTKEEYRQFQEDFASGTDGMKFFSTGGCPGCEVCGIPEDAEDYHVEPSFSWSSCDTCGSHLGGDRHPAHYRDDNDDIVHVEVCVDCLFYSEYGQLDDMTMMDIENA